MKGCSTRISGGVALLLVFALAAMVWWRQPEPPEAKPSEAGRDFASAWEDGRLDRLDYDPASAPGEEKVDANRIADTVTEMVEKLNPDDEDRPVAVRAVGTPRSVTAPEDDLRIGDRMQPLEVTWDLGHQHTWTYRTEVALRTTDGRERVLWRPGVVHPTLTQGLIMTTRRLRTERAPVLDATGAVLPAGAAPSLVGSVTTATPELAETNPDRVVAGDRIGTSGLQLVYDAQLAGTAGIEVDAVPVEGFAPLEPPVGQLHVVPPVPGKPLQLTLDPTWQARAVGAVAGATTPTGVVAVDAMTGQVIAAASAGGDGRSVALHGKYPPGGAFRLITTLALDRAGTSADSVGDCTPVVIDHQRFTNPTTAAGGATEPFEAVFATGCRTAFARAAADLDPDALDTAARDLGFAVPSSTGANAFDGVITTDGRPLTVIQNALGEGSTLASPLALARVAATVATGNQRPPTLVVPVTSSPPAPVEGSLTGPEQSRLGDLMRTSTRTDPQLAPLRSVTSAEVAAVAGTAGYGPAANAPIHAWCVGYQGTVAFAAFVAGAPSTGAVDPYQARKAAAVAARMLGGR